MPSIAINLKSDTPIPDHRLLSPPQRERGALAQFPPEQQRPADHAAGAGAHLPHSHFPALLGPDRPAEETRPAQVRTAQLSESGDGDGDGDIDGVFGLGA